MDKEPHNEKNEPRFERRDADRRREELLGTLPAPKEAAGFITAMLADDAREHILDAMSNGRPLDSVTARLIAYNLIAHAPEGSNTDALYDFFLTGYGEYENLRSEYLPLYNEPIMPAEGRVLLDSLGTYLFNRENRRTTPSTGHLYASAVVIGTERSGEQTAIAFSYSTHLEEDELEQHAEEMLRLCVRFGDGFRAYLRAPGVDSLSPTLIDNFHTAYITDVADADANRERLNNLGSFDWNAIEIGGGIHVFIHERHPGTDA